MNTIKSIIDEASKKIGYIESSIILEHVLGMDKPHIIINNNNVIGEEKYDEINYLISKVEKGYPIQYITHKQEFMGLNFYVDENVLIPQPDTEILVEESIKIIEKKCTTKQELRILDLCTGSGAIAISIADYIINNKNESAVDIKIVASDISEDALEVANKNCENIIKNNISIDFVKSDMFKNIEGKFDVIISNPPYIKSEEIKTLSKEVQNEPHIALDGGEDGLKFYKAIKDNMDKHLKENGTLLMEIGYDQKQDLLEIFEEANCIQDLSGNDRVIIIER